MDLEEANKKIHKAEDQWHYPIMIKHGWISDTKTGIGFVRSYDYHHPSLDIKITVTTGASCDYWSAKIEHEKISEGLWGSLEHFVKEKSK